MVVLTSFLHPTEGIRHEQANTSVHLNARLLGKGTLYVTESNVSWKDGSSGEGFSLQYPHITLHAVSRDLSSFPHECLYVMLDADIEKTAKDSDSDEEADEDGMTEIRFVPDDKGVLNLLFDAVKDCQALHPDPNDSFSDAEDEMFADAEEGEEEEDEYRDSVSHDGPNIQIRRSENNGVNNDHDTNGANDEEMELDPAQFEDADEFPDQ